MANTGFLTVNELDFNTLKSNLKTYLKGQAQFSDYDFDGSNINVLLDVLSYNTYMNSFYLNMVGSEMFLDTAQLKESVVSHAKELNYIPRSRTSAVAFVDLTISPGDSPDSIIIPKNYKLTTTIDNTTYNFYVGEDHIVVANNGVYTAANVAIYEGILATEYFNVTANSNFVLQSQTIDNRSIDVYVYESNTSAIPYTYSKAESLYGLTPTSNVYFLQGYSANQYELKFGDGVSGRSISPGNFVKVIYRNSNGEKGNGAYKFSKTSAIQGYTTISVATVTAAVNGSERETIDEIKYNAPRFFTSQERAVTIQDYETLTLNKFPEFQSVIAYGGEEMSPPQYGRVAISIKPYGSTAIVSDYLKSEVVNYLKGKSLTTEPIIVDPDFLYLKVDSSVKYDTGATTLGINQLSTLVSNAIISFANTNLTSFGSDLSYSKLTSAIDDADVSIIGNDTNIKLVKRWTPPTEQTNSISFSYNNELYHEDILYALPQGHDLTIKSSVFKYNSSNTLYNAYIGDDGVGTLKVYTDQTNSNGTVTRLTINENAGTVNVFSGAVTITANVYSFTGSHINIAAQLKAKDVVVVRNAFLLISPLDVKITMVPVITA